MAEGGGETPSWVSKTAHGLIGCRKALGFCLERSAAAFDPAIQILVRIMFMNQRTSVVYSLPAEYVRSPSLRHMREERSLAKLTLEIVTKLDRDSSVWKKWQGPRDKILGAAIECWIPKEDMLVLPPWLASGWFPYGTHIGYMKVHQVTESVQAGHRRSVGRKPLIDQGLGLTRPFLGVVTAQERLARVAALPSDLDAGQVPEGSLVIEVIFVRAMCAVSRRRRGYSGISGRSPA